MATLAIQSVNHRCDARRRSFNVTAVRGRLSALLRGVMAAGMAMAMVSVHAETLTERIKRGEPVRQAVANDSPFGYSGPDGKIIGIEVELVEHILHDMGAKVEVTSTTFGALIPGIQAGRFDIASDGMYVRPERCKVAKFSTPDFMIGAGAFIRKGNDTVHVSTMDALAQQKNLRFGKLTGGQEDKAFAAAGGDISQISNFTDRVSLTSAVKSKRIDVGLLSALGAAAAVNNDDGLRLISPLKPPMQNGKPFVYYAGFAFAKSDPAFVEEFNRRLKAIIRSPDYVKLLAKYKVPADVIPVTNVEVASLCNEQN
ncbi:transporter substrate-binding domain-containing protein [Burkholderia sp. WSM2232]|uniref:transporter substrate-binding domain-containing protein n=1 Tax=Burkholderia sp. WSM2232 TaxID=944436 RepID=UPI00040838B4|nr:transporter substrate-binding domain-containing protein [Burkholderia sp. WSM2232]